MLRALRLLLIATACEIKPENNQTRSQRVHKPPVLWTFVLHTRSARWISPRDRIAYVFTSVFLRGTLCFFLLSRGKESFRSVAAKTNEACGLQSRESRTILVNKLLIFYRSAFLFFSFSRFLGRAKL